jgi:hypothetical protein
MGAEYEIMDEIDESMLNRIVKMRKHQRVENLL